MRNNRGNVQNQHDGSVAEDGSAAHNRRGDQLIFKSLDDQFFFAHQAIHGEAKLASASADHNHKKARGPLADGVRPEPVQPNERENLFAQLKYFVIVNAMNALLGDPGDFGDGSKRHGIEASVDAEQKRPNTGESERNEQAERGAAPGRACEFDRAFQRFERRLDNVETDATPGNFRDFVGGAEARSKNQLEPL